MYNVYYTYLTIFYDKLIFLRKFSLVLVTGNFSKTEKQNEKYAYSFFFFKLIYRLKI